MTVNRIEVARLVMEDEAEATEGFLFITDPPNVKLSHQQIIDALSEYLLMEEAEKVSNLNLSQVTSKVVN
jgi:hypothetical protein